MEHEERAERLERDVDDMEQRSEKLEERIEEARQGAEDMSETPKESDQLPEEGPEEQVHDDTGRASRRKERNESPGAKGDEGTATGNPDAAGSDE